MLRRWRRSLAEYPSYEAARTRCGMAGWEHPLTVEAVLTQRHAVPHAAMDTLRPFLTSGVVLDYGGGIGHHYGIAKALGRKITRWVVLETPALVTRVRHAATCELRFVSSMEEATQYGPFDVVYANGVLQYTERPAATLATLVELGAPLTWITRFPLTSQALPRYAVQHTGAGLVPITFDSRDRVRDVLTGYKRHVLYEDPRVFRLRGEWMDYDGYLVWR